MDHKLSVLDPPSFSNSPPASISINTWSPAATRSSAHIPFRTTSNRNYESGHASGEESDYQVFKSDIAHILAFRGAFSPKEIDNCLYFVQALGEMSEKIFVKFHTGGI